MSKKIIAFLLTLSALLFAQQPLEWHFKDGLQGWKFGGFESHEITPEGFHGKVKYDAMLFSPTLISHSSPISAVKSYKTVNSSRVLFHQNTLPSSS